MLKITKAKQISIILLAFVALTGCANHVNSPVTGSLFTNIKHSGAFTGGVFDNTVQSAKTGTSSCTSVLVELFAFGDCSEEKAMKNGGIVKVNSVAHQTTSFALFFVNYQTIVTGE